MTLASDRISHCFPITYRLLPVEEIKSVDPNDGLDCTAISFLRFFLHANQNAFILIENAVSASHPIAIIHFVLTNMNCIPCALLLVIPSIVSFVPLRFQEEEPDRVEPKAITFANIASTFLSS